MGSDPILETRRSGDGANLVVEVLGCLSSKLASRDPGAEHLSQATLVAPLRLVNRDDTEPPPSPGRRLAGRFQVQ